MSSTQASTNATLKRSMATPRNLPRRDPDDLCDKLDAKFAEREAYRAQTRQMAQNGSARSWLRQFARSMGFGQR